MRISDWSSDVCSSDLKRLILISAGNTITDNFGAGDHLDICDHPDHEIESPAQAWNAICVAFCTEQTVFPHGHPVAALRDQSPSSRTTSCNYQCPLTPAVVLEGGHWMVEGTPAPQPQGAICRLRTHTQI